jgi:4-hydroxy-3-methylbut-2-enyl diphosphate reductase
VDDTADVIDALRERFPAIKGPRKDDICYATQNRQDAVRQLANQVDLMLVVGAKNSSNSNRLRELAEKVGTKAYLIDDASNIDEAWLADSPTVGVTAGASAPDVLVKGVVTRLQELGATSVKENPGKEEDIVFAVPAELR